MNNTDIAVLKSYASGRWLDIIAHLAPHLAGACQKPGRHVRCPCHGQSDGFRLFADAAETGGGHCNLNGSFADGFSLLQWTNGWSFREVVDAVASYLGFSDGKTLPAPRTHIQKKTPPKCWDNERRYVQRIWDEARPDRGRIAQYFEFRGLSRNVRDAVRLHLGLYYQHDDESGIYPAMVARIILDYEVVGIHRTWLDKNGPGKAPVSNPKKTFKCVDTMTGGAIQLFEPEPNKPLALTEGIESALAVHALSGYPTWSCISSTMLAKVQVPAAAEVIYIAADKDRSGAGKRAAEELANRLYLEGKRVRLSFPPISIPNGSKSVDWLDWLVVSREVSNV